MTVREALTILTEMQLWRRGLPPYDGETPETHRKEPYSPQEFGQAIDVAIEALEHWISESPVNQTQYD